MPRTRFHRLIGLVVFALLAPRSFDVEACTAPAGFTAQSVSDLMSNVFSPMKNDLQTFVKRFSPDWVGFVGAIFDYNPYLYLQDLRDQIQTALTQRSTPTPGEFRPRFYPEHDQYAFGVYKRVTSYPNYPNLDQYRLIIYPATATNIACASAHPPLDVDRTRVYLSGVHDVAPILAIVNDLLPRDTSTTTDADGIPEAVAETYRLKTLATAGAKIRFELTLARRDDICRAFTQGCPGPGQVVSYAPGGEPFKAGFYWWNLYNASYQLAPATLTFNLEHWLQHTAYKRDANWSAYWTYGVDHDGDMTYEGTTFTGPGSTLAIDAPAQAYGNHWDAGCPGRCGRGCGQETKRRIWDDKCLEHDQLAENALFGACGLGQPGCKDLWTVAVKDASIQAKLTAAISATTLTMENEEWVNYPQLWQSYGQDYESNIPENCTWSNATFAPPGGGAPGRLQGCTCCGYDHAAVF